MKFSESRNFLIRLVNWEFWPWQIIYFPVMLFWLWLSIKARSLFFFAAVNPGIESGGLLVESKSAILDLLADDLKPKTRLMEYPISFEEVIEKLKAGSIRFPVIVKPDHGERGRRVEKIEDREELRTYIKTVREDFIIQEYIDLPLETGIFYYRYPGQEQGTISSLVIKELLHVTGDGSSTVETLMEKDPRARLQIKRVRKRHPGLMNRVPDKGEKIELVPIGNHRRGATFLNGNHLIDEALTEVVDEFARKIEGFFYGRFDIRCAGMEELKKGKTIKILELNGAKSEPAHIYDPGFSLAEAYKVLFTHWRIIYRIARENHKRGVKYPSWNEGWAMWKKFRYYKNLH